MRRIVLLVASLALVGGGCTGLFQAGTSVDTSVEGDGEVTFTSPPAIAMSAGGKTVAGVEGSYCFGPMCVDKIAPIDLVAEAGLDFEAISRSNILFSNEAALSSMSVSLMNESGASVGQSTELTESSSGEFAYTIPSSVPAGDYYLSVFATFEEGGDVSYIFPISVK